MNQSITKNADKYIILLTIGFSFLLLFLSLLSLQSSKATITELNPEKYYQLGQSAYHVGNLNESLSYYEKGLAIQPNNTTLLFFKAIVLADLKMLPEAINTIDKLLHIDSNDSYANVLQGYYLTKLGNYQEAIKYIDKGISLEPNNSLFLYYKGLYYSAQNDLQLATEFFKKSIAIDPTFSDSLVEMGSIMTGQFNVSAANMYYDKALAIEPNNFRALYGKSLILLFDKKSEEALKFIDEAITIEPENSQALYLKGRILFSQGSYEEAAEYFDKSLFIDPNNLNTINYKGASILAQGFPKQALEYFDKVLDIDPSYEDGLYRKGLALAELQEYSQAINFYDMALSTSSDEEKRGYILQARQNAFEMKERLGSNNNDPNNTKQKSESNFNSGFDPCPSGYFLSDDTEKCETQRSLNRDASINAFNQPKGENLPSGLVKVNLDLQIELDNDFTEGKEKICIDPGMGETEFYCEIKNIKNQGMQNLKSEILWVTDKKGNICVSLYDDRQAMRCKTIEYESDRNMNVIVDFNQSDEEFFGEEDPFGDND